MLSEMRSQILIAKLLDYSLYTGATPLPLASREFSRHVAVKMGGTCCLVQSFVENVCSYELLSCVLLCQAFPISGEGNESIPWC